MVLINVDFPQPLGPRMATCSPAWRRRVMSCRTVFSTRMTEMCWESIRGTRSGAATGFLRILREYTASMLKITLILCFVTPASLLFGQLDSNSVTVTASRSANVQLDQVLLAVYVTSG